jgi:hypothetical protein
MDRKTLLASLLLGIGVSLVTGLLPREVALGATQYGWPLTWRVHMVVAPELNPWRILPAWFVVDAAFWSLLAFLIIYYVRRR